MQGGLNYRASYWISDEVNEGQVIGVALAIYMDGSRQFEAWGGTLLLRHCGAWTNVPWPSALVIPPTGSESGLWRFIGEETTWDLDEALELLRGRLWRGR